MSFRFGAPSASLVGGDGAWGEPLRAKWWPAFASGAAVVLSFGMAILWRGHSFPEVPVFPIVGYLLTPFSTAFFLIVARKLDNQNAGNDLYDVVSGRKVIRVTSVLAILGFLIGLFHILMIADYMALLLAPGS